MGVLLVGLKSLERGAAIEAHVEARVVAGPQPPREGPLELLAGRVSAPPVELLLLGLVAPLDLPVEPRGAGRDEPVLGTKLPIHPREGAGLHGAIDRGPGARGIPVREGHVVVGLDAAHREKEG